MLFRLALLAAVQCVALLAFFHPFLALSTIATFHYLHKETRKKPTT